MTEGEDIFESLIRGEREARASKLETNIRLALINSGVYDQEGEWSIHRLDDVVGLLQLRNEGELSHVSLITSDALMSPNCDGHFVFQDFTYEVPRITTIDSFADSTDMHHYCAVEDMSVAYKEVDLDLTERFELFLGMFLVSMCTLRVVERED